MPAMLPSKSIHSIKAHAPQTSLKVTHKTKLTVLIFCSLQQ
jgi:hypothetical protein